MKRGSISGGCVVKGKALGGLVALSLLLGLPARNLAHEPAQGTFTTIDFPGAAGTIVPPSFEVNINTEGQVVGCYFLVSGGMVHGFLLSHGSFTTIDFPESIFTELGGINPPGDIVGNYIDATELRVHVLLLRQGTFSTIDFPGAVGTFVGSINPASDIVGGYFEADGFQHGFVLSHGAFSKVDFPGAIATIAFGINPEGQIVGGYLDTDLNVHGFLLSEGSFSTFDFPGAVGSVFACGSSNCPGGTCPLGINPQGDIVGGYCGGDGNNHGFLLSKGNFNAIDFPGATFTFVNGITPEGDMAGGYQSADGVYHGFVLNNSGGGHKSAELLAPSQTREGPKIAPPENLRNLLLRRWRFGKLKPELLGPQ